MNLYKFTSRLKCILKYYIINDGKKLNFILF